MQLKLETNLPVIFLTLLVIAVVVMGYLELKKMNERIKHLEYLNKNKDDKKDIKKPNISENVPPQPVKQETIQEPLQETTESKNANRVEEWQMNNEKENIIDTLNGKDEYIEEINEKDEQIYFNEGMYSVPSMMYHMGSEKEDIIDQISRNDNIDFENIQGEEDKIEGEGEGEGEGVGEGEGEEIIKDEEEVIDVVVDREEEKEEEEEVIDLKEISQNDDFEKNKIYVDESFSVNELKLICKNLGIQSSGNKTTLITRIMDNQ